MRAPSRPAAAAGCVGKYYAAAASLASVLPVSYSMEEGHQMIRVSSIDKLESASPSAVPPSHSRCQSLLLSESAPRTAAVEVRLGVHSVTRNQAAARSLPVATEPAAAAQPELVSKPESSLSPRQHS